MPGTERTRRVFGVAMAVGLMGMAIGLTPLAGVAAACDPQAPQADLSLTQTTVMVPDTGNILYTLFVTNGGPCVATGITFFDTLPPGSEVVSISVKPGSLECDITPPSDPSDRGTVACIVKFAADPGKVIKIALLTTPPSSNDVGNDPIVDAAETDPNPANNEVTGGLVGEDGGMLETGEFPQIFAVGVPGPGEVLIQQGALDEPCPFPDCFGRRVDLTAPSAPPDDRLELTFRFDVSILPPGVPALSNRMWHLPDGATEWVKVLRPCQKTGADPCHRDIKLTICPEFVSESNPRGTCLKVVVLSQDNGSWQG